MDSMTVSPGTGNNSDMIGPLAWAIQSGLCLFDPVGRISCPLLWRERGWGSSLIDSDGGVTRRKLGCNDTAFPFGVLILTQRTSAVSILDRHRGFLVLLLSWCTIRKSRIT